MVERKQAGKNVPKSHPKLYYQVAYKGAKDVESFILPDVLYGDCHDEQVQEVEIDSPFIATEGEKHLVKVPSVCDILGDKPFVYNTPYYIENAIVDASKAAYLATLLKHGVMRVEKYSGDTSSLPDMTTVSNWPSKLNKLKKLNPEAYSGID